MLSNLRTSQLCALCVAGYFHQYPYDDKYLIRTRLPNRALTCTSALDVDCALFYFKLICDIIGLTVNDVRIYYNP